MQGLQRYGGTNFLFIKKSLSYVHVCVSQLSQVVRASVFYLKGCGFDFHFGVFISLSKRLYLHCSIYPAV